MFRTGFFCIDSCLECWRCWFRAVTYRWPFMLLQAAQHGARLSRLWSPPASSSSMWSTVSALGLPQYAQSGLLARSLRLLAVYWGSRCALLMLSRLRLELARRKRLALGFLWSVLLSGSCCLGCCLLTVCHLCEPNAVMLTHGLPQSVTSLPT